MCGSSPQPATITAPDYSSYNRMADLQLQAIKDSQSNAVTLKQGELVAAQTKQEKVLSDLNTQANETAANAQRIAALIGAPVPEKAAAAPTLADNRAGMAKSKGRASFRIDRAPTARAGTGLNIGVG